MPNNNDKLSGRVALITGAAHRLGAAIARCLHAHGMNIVLHCRTSRAAADALEKKLNSDRGRSVVVVQGNLLNNTELTRIATESIKAWNRIDILINNASSFYETPLGSATEQQWDDLLGTNLKAPFFLTQALAGQLQQQQGCIVNITDIHAQRPLKTYPVYSVAKAGLAMLTKAMARELGPAVRCNAIAPGTILWPEGHMSEFVKEEIISRTALKRQGHPDDVARAVLFLIRDADYMTGEIITVDGGRSLGI